MTTFLCDTNVWLALAITEHAHHDSARAWVESVGSTDTLLFCRSTQQSVLRLLTQSAATSLYLDRPLTNEEAWTAYRRLSADDRVRFQRDEPLELELLWAQFASRPMSSPKLWMDAYLAAFARAAGYRLVTFDSAFHQFENVDVLLLGADR